MTEIEWTDAEREVVEKTVRPFCHLAVVQRAATVVLNALAPHVAARAAQAAAKAEGRVKQAIRECHDGPAKAVFDADRLAGEAIIRAHAAEAERDQLRHLLGSHADGHRCTCEMTDPGTPNISPPEWEQDPWCLTHPDMSVITAEVERLRERLAAVEATAADENLTMACDWSDFRKDYGVSSDPEISSREHRAFKAGWQAGRHGDQSGVLR